MKFSNPLLIILNWRQRCFGKKESCNLWAELWGGAGEPGQQNHSVTDPVVMLKPKEELVWGLLLGGHEPGVTTACSS